MVQMNYFRLGSVLNVSDEINQKFSVNLFKINHFPLQIYFLIQTEFSYQQLSET